MTPAGGPWSDSNDGLYYVPTNVQIQVPWHSVDEGHGCHERNRPKTKIVGVGIGDEVEVKSERIRGWDAGANEVLSFHRGFSHSVCLPNLARRKWSSKRLCNCLGTIANQDQRLDMSSNYRSLNSAIWKGNW